MNTKLPAIVDLDGRNTNPAHIKLHEMPAHHNLEAYLDAYIEAAGIHDGGKAPPSARRPGAPAR